MNPFEVQALMIAVSLKMNALAHWVLNNDLSPQAVVFFDAFLIAVAKHADTIMAVMFDPGTQVVAGRRCIFY